jgi:hypothetical protein
MSLALLFCAELLYRGVNGLRSVMAGAGSEAPVNPLDSTSWYGEYAREAEAAQDLVWKPYVYFRREPSFQGRYITIDSLGRRVTPQPAPAQPAARVFMFGGSTMWGWFQRDDHTIPAETARRLHHLRDTIGPVEVTNFGETGYVFTQELLELMLQLRAGNVPDVVVFYDGINDAASTLQAREGGIAQNEAKRVSEFALGRELDRARYNYTLGRDLRAIGRLAIEGLQHLAIVDRLQRAVRSDGPPLFPLDSAVTATVSAYVENVRLVEALARAYDFEAIFMWQPTLYSTEKKLTPFETNLRNSVRADPVRVRLEEVHRAVPPRLDSALTPLVGTRFINGTSLFGGDTIHVYADRSSHTTEEAVPTIVSAFLPALRAALVRQRR